MLWYFLAVSGSLFATFCLRPFAFLIFWLFFCLLPFVFLIFWLLFSFWWSWSRCASFCFCFGCLSCLIPHITMSGSHFCWLSASSFLFFSSRRPPSSSLCVCQSTSLSTFLYQSTSLYQLVSITFICINFFLSHSSLSTCLHYRFLSIIRHPGPTSTGSCLTRMSVCGSTVFTPGIKSL